MCVVSCSKIFQMVIPHPFLIVNPMPEGAPLEVLQIRAVRVDSLWFNQSARLERATAVNSLCRWILASWCCVACATASAGTTVWVNIPQESIVKALKDFSRQSGVKVVAELTAEEAGLSMNG